MQVIYIDTLFFINALVNYLILLAAAKICSASISRVRLIISSAVGGMYAVLSVFSGFGFLTSPFIKIGFGALLVLIAFGREKRLLRIQLIFFAVSAGFAGVVLGLSFLSGGDITQTVYSAVSLKILLPAFAVSYFVLSLVFKRAYRKKTGGGYCSVQIELNGEKSLFRGLYDTGNALTDPITGKPIIIADCDAINKIMPRGVKEILTEKAVKNPVSAIEALGELRLDKGFRLVPYSTVGTSFGMLLAFRPERVVVDGEVQNGVLVAFAPNQVSDGGIYSALVGVSS